MNNIKTIENRRPIKTIENDRPTGGDYFKLIYSRRSDKYLKDFLPLFNFDDYWCYKRTGKQRHITYEDLLKFEYSGYIFFKKDIYNKENIDLWINFIYLLYLDKPTPPFNPNKIKIRK